MELRIEAASGAICCAYSHSACPSTRGMSLNRLAPICARLVEEAVPMMEDWALAITVAVVAASSSRASIAAVYLATISA